MGPQHAYQIATRLQQISDRLLNLNQGTLYPALVRLEQYGWIESALVEVEQPIGDLLETRGDLIGVLRAHGLECAQDDEVKCPLQQLN